MRFSCAISRSNGACLGSILVLRSLCFYARLALGVRSSCARRALGVRSACACPALCMRRLSLVLRSLGFDTRLALGERSACARRALGVRSTCACSALCMRRLLLGLRSCLRLIRRSAYARLALILCLACAVTRSASAPVFDAWLRRSACTRWALGLCSCLQRSSYACARHAPSKARLALKPSTLGFDARHTLGVRLSCARLALKFSSLGFDAWL